MKHLLQVKLIKYKFPSFVLSVLLQSLAINVEAVIFYIRIGLHHIS